MLLRNPVNGKLTESKKSTARMIFEPERIINSLKELSV